MIETLENPKVLADKGFTPEKLEQVKIKKPANSSAGISSVISSLKHLSRYTGLIKGLKLSLKLNQKDGFDCPGCAWPDPDDDRSVIAEYCENGIKAIAEEAQSKLIGEKFFATNNVQSLRKLTDFEIGKSGRIDQPMIIQEGKTNYDPISWEKAFQIISEKLKSLESPNEAIFYTSGRTSNETAYLYQLFVRVYGTNNLPDCSNLCHESSGVALSKTVGIGKGSVTLDDFEKAELILVLGQNPGTNHPRMLIALEKCKAAGGKIISINPIIEAGLVNFINPKNPAKMISGGTDLSDLYLQIPINRDLQLLKAVLKMLWEEEKKNPGNVFDAEFIKKYTTGYEELIAELEQANLENLICDSGAKEVQIRKMVKMILAKKNIIVCWAMGLTQHKNAVNVIQEIVNLLLLKGSIGRPGAGTCPVRGHSNVQGDRTMGIWEAPKEPFLKKLDDIFGIQAPREHGYPVVGAIKAMKEKKAKVFFAMGGNFLSAAPDTEITTQALKNCDLTVHVSTKLNRSHTVHGKIGLILPCKGRTDRDFQNSKEQFVTVENSTGYVSGSKGILEPASKKWLSEAEIVGRLALATLPESSIDWKSMYLDYGIIRDYIGKTIPGFENFNKKVGLKKGFYIANGARERKFNTPSQKAVFTVNLIEDVMDLKSGEFTMMTIRSHDQFNTTVYGLDDRYRGIYNGRRVVLMNPEDAKQMGFAREEIVDLSSNYDGQERRANLFKIVYYSIAPGCVATYFPEANSLISFQETARESKTPIYKSVKISIKKTTAEIAH